MLASYSDISRITSKFVKSDDRPTAKGTLSPLQPSDGMILEIGPRSEGHPVTFRAPGGGNQWRTGYRQPVSTYHWGQVLGQDGCRARPLTQSPRPGAAAWPSRVGHRPPPSAAPASAVLGRRVYRGHSHRPPSPERCGAGYPASPPFPPVSARPRVGPDRRRIHIQNFEFVAVTYMRPSRKSSPDARDCAPRARAIFSRAWQWKSTENRRIRQPISSYPWGQAGSPGARGRAQGRARGRAPATSAAPAWREDCRDLCPGRSLVEPAPSSVPSPLR